MTNGADPFSWQAPGRWGWSRSWGLLLPAKTATGLYGVPRDQSGRVAGHGARMAQPVPLLNPLWPINPPELDLASLPFKPGWR
jgi:hypothetical protein